VLVAVAAGALTLDVISKVIVVAQLSDRPPVELLGGLLTLRVTRNSGAAFSIGTGMTFVLTLIAVSVIIAILRTARRLRSLPWAITLGLLLGGATGNLLDRLLRSPGPLRGHVVDWIELPHWPVFNLADSAIVCGGVIAVLLATKGLQIDGTRATDESTTPTAEDKGGAAEQDTSLPPDTQSPASLSMDSRSPDSPSADPQSPGPLSSDPQPPAVQSPDGLSSATQAPDTLSPDQQSSDPQSPDPQSPDPQSPDRKS
jgi:signal peptidase II